jgi:hypothetical protein
LGAGRLVRRFAPTVLTAIAAISGGEYHARNSKALTFNQAKPLALSLAGTFSSESVVVQYRGRARNTLLVGFACCREIVPGRCGK